MSNALHCISETIIFWSRWAYIRLLSSSDCSHLHLAFFHTPDNCFLVSSHVHNYLILWHSLIVHIQISSRVLCSISWSSPRTALRLILSLVTYKYKVRTINYASLPTLAMKFLPTWHCLLSWSGCVERLTARSGYRLSSWVIELLNFLSNPCTSVHESIFFIVLFEILTLIRATSTIFLTFVSTQLLLQSRVIHASSRHHRLIESL